MHTWRTVQTAADSGGETGGKHHDRTAYPTRPQLQLPTGMHRP